MEMQKREVAMGHESSRRDRAPEPPPESAASKERRQQNEQAERDRIADEENAKFWKRTEFAKEHRPDLDKMKEEASSLDERAKKMEDRLKELTEQLSLAEEKVKHAEDIVQRGQKKEMEDLEKRVALLKSRAQEVSQIAASVKRLKAERLAARKLADEALGRYRKNLQQYKTEISKYAPKSQMELLEQYDAAKNAPEEAAPEEAVTAEEMEKTHEGEIIESMDALRQLKQSGQEAQYQEAKKELINEIINSMSEETLPDDVQEQLAGQDTWMMLDSFAKGQLKSPENVLGMLKNAANKRLESIYKRQQRTGK